MRALAIRTRLTLWYFCFFAIAGLLLSSASWLLLRRSLDILQLHELDERVDDIESFLSTLPPDISLQALRVELMREYQLKDEGKWLQILDQNMHWLYCSNRGAIANPLPDLPQSPGHLFPFKSAGQHSLRVYSRQLLVHKRGYSVSMAISADNSAIILTQFRWDLWLLVPAALLLAAMAGHFLSRKALRPVAAIVAEARTISERNLGARLPVVDTRDELSQLSETLNQMLERIEIAFRSVRSLTANASHELRTPTSLIRTRVEIALCFPRTADHYRAVLEEIHAETLRMTTLIENLLTLARAEAGATSPELRPVEMTELMEVAAQEWIPTAERLSLDLRVIPAPAPAWILGDRNSLERLIRTLLDNACRYTPSGGCIRISLGVASDRVTLAVEDNGIGIESTDLPRIFERFYRAQKSQHQDRNGSGLGLSLAKWIADQHKASITVESTPGLGSSFRFVFAKHVPMQQPYSVAG